MKLNLKTARGFTLVELLIVIAIIAVFAALLLPALNAAKSKSKRATCMNNIRQINLGIRMYSDDSNDSTPSESAAEASTNTIVLFSSYKAFMKSYVGLHGISSSRDKIFACPADAFYSNWAVPPAGPPWGVVQKSLHDKSVWDFSSYSFNGGDNATRTLKTTNGPLVFESPGLTKVKLSSVKHPGKTILVSETSAIFPWSWHEPSSHGDAAQDGTVYNDAKNVISFVDGHVSFEKIYWDSTGKLFACNYNPPEGYDYQWSPD